MINFVKRFSIENRIKSEIKAPKRVKVLVGALLFPRIDLPTWPYKLESLFYTMRLARKLIQGLCKAQNPEAIASKKHKGAPKT